MKQTADMKLFHQYNSKLKKEKKLVFTWQFLILICFLALWQIASSMYWVDPLLFSSPSSVFKLIFGKIADGSILTHVQVTLLETVLVFIIGTVAGILIATVLWSSLRFSKIMDPYLVIMNAMPKVALGPIIIVSL